MNVEESASEKECNLYAKGLRSKVKLSLYRTLSKKVGFKKYMHGMSDAESKLLIRDAWVE